MGCLMDDNEIVYFLHIPKTAGTSFQFYLAQYFSGDEICPAQVQAELLKIPIEKLRRYRLFAGHFWAIRQLLDRPPKLITILREPVARAISNYRHILRDPDHHLHKRAVSGSIEHLTRFPAIRNGQTRHLAGNHPAYDRRLNDEECGSLAFEVLDEACFVGVVERFDISMAMLALTFNWPAMVDLPQFNKAWPTKTASFSKNELEALEEANQIDKKVYDYAVQWLERRCAQQLNELAQQSYEQTIEQAAKASPLKFSLGNAIPGRGWYRAEQMGIDGPFFRWSIPRRIATLDMPVIPKRARKVRFEVLGCTPEMIRDSLRLTIWGREVPLRGKRQPSDMSTIYEGDLTAVAATAEKNFLRLEFHVSESSVPNESEINSDSRKLGAAISWVEVK